MAEYPDRMIQQAALARCVADGDHLLWQGPLGHGKYPRFVYRSREYRLRPIWWRVSGRPLAPEERLRNSCGQPRCVVPEHQAVYAADNGWSTRRRRAAQGYSRKAFGVFARAMASEVWRAWPAEPEGVRAPCYVCRQSTLVRPGYLPYCDACAEKVCAPLGADARRDHVPLDVWG